MSRRFVVEGDGIYSHVIEASPSDQAFCDTCGREGHRTGDAAQRCLIRWLSDRARSFREAAHQLRKELRESKKV